MVLISLKGFEIGKELDSQRVDSDLALESAGGNYRKIDLWVQHKSFLTTVMLPK